MTTRAYLVIGDLVIGRGPGYPPRALSQHLPVRKLDFRSDSWLALDSKTQCNYHTQTNDP